MCISIAKKRPPGGLLGKGGHWAHRVLGPKGGYPYLIPVTTINLCGLVNGAEIVIPFPILFYPLSDDVDLYYRMHYQHTCFRQVKY